MKVSVSIPDSDVAFLDEYAQSHGIASRSAAVHRAIRLLRASDLSRHYAAAFAEWVRDGEHDAWEAVVGDGLAEAEVGDSHVGGGPAGDEARNPVVGEPPLDD